MANAPDNQSGKVELAKSEAQGEGQSLGRDQGRNQEQRQSQKQAEGDRDTVTKEIRNDEGESSRKAS